MFSIKDMKTKCDVKNRYIQLSYKRKKLMKVCFMREVIYRKSE